MNLTSPKAPVTAAIVVALTGALAAPSPAFAQGELRQASICGDNSSGQLGDGTYVDASTPQGVLPGANASDIWSVVGAGGTFSCGINSSDAAFCWGDNSDGALGNGMPSSTDDSVPIAVVPGANAANTWTFVDGGWNFMCGLGANARAYCWGDNSYGQLGNSTRNTSDDSLPVLVAPGANSSGVYSTLSVGYSFVCGITATDAAYCWGDNASGQLGTGSTSSTDDSVPGLVLPGANTSGGWKSISTGSGHTCGIALSGLAYCWGANFAGQLGDNSTNPSPTPIAVQFAGTWESIAAGEENTCGVSSVGQLYCWGGNTYGTLGQGTSGGSGELVPTLITSPTNVADVQMGQDHVCATTSESIYCWGRNNNGQAGIGVSGANVTTPQEVTSVRFSGLVPVQLALGSYHTMALMGTLAPIPSGPSDPIPASSPRNVIAKAGDAAATVTWQPPSSAGSFPISHYLITSTPAGRHCLAPAPALTCEVTGLTNGTAYTFTVQALTGAGWSVPSDPSNAVIPRTDAGPSVVITGSRDGKRIVVAGTTTGFGMGGVLDPWLRLPGQSTFSKGAATILVSMDGTFEWSRRAGKRVSVYVATPDQSVRSNTVRIPRG